MTEILIIYSYLTKKNENGNISCHGALITSGVTNRFWRQLLVI